jgi:hypothetical protein
MSTLIALCNAVLDTDHLLFHAIARDLTMKAAAEDIVLAPCEISSLSGSDAGGFAARVAINGSASTILLGAPEVISQATTPFHSEIESIFASQKHSVDERTFAYAIDGITYAALIVTSELRPA